MVVLLLAVVGLFVIAERVPLIRQRLPWLPRLPWVHGETAAVGEDQDKAGAERSGRRGGGRSGDKGAPIPVLVADTRYDDLPVTVDVLGTVQATNTVTVRSQVDGKLVGVEFQEGQDVRKGQVLARIDPAALQATYDQAVAKKAQDASILANAQVDLTRYAKLAATQYGSGQQADTQKALVAQTQAIVSQDQAAIDSARTTLDYATIRSPIDGRAGLRLVDAGNIVHASDTTGLVTVTQVRPVAVVFNLPQQNLRSVNASLARGPLRAQALDGDNTGVLDEGTLAIVDNAVDQTTGTVKLKGSFANDHLQLWPGQFVNVRLFIDTLAHVVVVPTAAIQRGPAGAFVYVANEQTVTMRKVTVGRQTEETSVITSGLDVPTRIVTTGFTRLTDGARIAVNPPAADAPLDEPAGQPAQTAPPGEPAPGEKHHRKRRGGDTASRSDGSGAPAQSSQQ